MAAATLTLENPVFRTFLGYACVVILKMLIMSFLTAYYRMSNKAFANEEDTKAFSPKKKLPVSVGHPDVERVRRCHRNDLENVVPFVLLGLLYVATGPSVWAASLHFRIFTISRLLHTVVYVAAVPQPSRAMAFFTGMLVNLSMAWNILQQAAF